MIYGYIYIYTYIYILWWYHFLDPKVKSHQITMGLCCLDHPFPAKNPWDKNHGKSCAQIASLPVPLPEVNTSPLGFGVGAPPGAESSSTQRGFGESSGASKARRRSCGEVLKQNDQTWWFHGDSRVILRDFAWFDDFTKASGVFELQKKCDFRMILRDLMMMEDTTKQ